MRTSYANADLIRSMEPESFVVTDTDESGANLIYTDAILRGWATDYADPEIDARLGTGFGVPFPITSVEDLVSSTPWTTVTSATGGFTGKADLILVVLSGTNFTAVESRIVTVTSDTEMIVETAVSSAGASSAGFAWIADAPALIRRISAMLAAAHGLDANVARGVSRTVGRSDDLRTRAFELLDDLKKGSITISGYPTGTYSGAVVTEQTPETRPDTQVFSGDPEDWAELAETREG